VDTNRLRSRRMSVDMGVWEGERPGSNEDAAEAFEALYDLYIERENETEPTPRIKEFVEALLAEFPDLDVLADDDVDDSPWADSPLLGNASGPFIYFAMVANDAAEKAWELATATAKRLDLVAFDPQSGTLT
jgi:hypothetical protein